MKRLIALTLMAVLAAMLVIPTPAEARTTVDYQRMMPSSGSATGWQKVVAQETTSTVVTGVKGYAYVQLCAVVDSLGATPTLAPTVQYRLGTYNTIAPATIYYSAWANLSTKDSLTKTDSLYTCYVNRCDTAATIIMPWYNIYVRAFGEGTNDSSKVRVWALKLCP